MGDTEISWTHRPGTRGRTWNPVRGCSRTIAAGAKQSGCGDGTGGGCYAERMAGRFGGPGKPYEGLVRITAKGARWTGVVRLVTEHLADPLRWREPSTIFVNSMSDLFHEELTNKQIAAVFGIAAACPQHIFQCLTKRAQRLPTWFKWLDEQIETEANDDSGADCSVSIHDARAEARASFLANAAADELSDGSQEDRDRWYDRLSSAIQDGWARTGDDGGTEWTMPWPLTNWWQGVSVENQEAADERLPFLLATPAAVRFLSCEPLLGPLTLMEPVTGGLRGPAVIRTPYRSSGSPSEPDEWDVECEVGIDLIIVGAESGPGARPAEPAWFRDLRDQCRAAGVAFFVKQIVADGKLRKDVSEFPTDLQIQEFPR